MGLLTSNFRNTETTAASAHCVRTISLVFRIATGWKIESMKPPKYKELLNKSVHAALSAIEIYNKPDFKYREETFSILMINAWELLLKARIVKEKNDYKAIFELENKIGKNGNKLKTKKFKENRSGNPMSISLQKCIDICIAPPIDLNESCKENIIILMEIRDTAIHLQNNDKMLSKKIFEVGTASLKNYLYSAKDWFNYDLSKYNFYLMPLSFYHEFDTVDSFSIKNDKEQIDNLLKFISNIEKNSPSNVDTDYNISLNLKTTFIRSTDLDSLKIDFNTNPNNPTTLNVNISDEDITKRYPIGSSELMKKAKVRYTDIKIDKKYHTLLKLIHDNKKYCLYRKFYPNSPKSKGARFYSTEIFKYLDEHYQK